jgi:hypothetical protein
MAESYFDVLDIKILLCLKKKTILSYHLFRSKPIKLYNILSRKTG